jgi:peptide deformylase
VPDDWIRQWGDPTLRAVASPVAVLDDLLKLQVRRMEATLLAADGAGLAATQVGHLRRVVVFRFTPEAPVDAIVNPQIVAASDAQATFVEGCLLREHRAGNAFPRVRGRAALRGAVCGSLARGKACLIGVSAAARSAGSRCCHRTR